MSPLSVVRPRGNVWPIVIVIAGATTLFSGRNELGAAEPRRAPSVWIEAPDIPDELPRDFFHQVLLHEIVRQAWAIAAEDGMGASVRDAVLREPASEGPPPLHAFKIDTQMARSGKVRIQVMCGGKKLVDLEDFAFPAANYINYLKLTDYAERQSRDSFVKALQEAGVKARPLPTKSKADVPESAARRLEQLNFAAQFAAVRELRVAIREQGESPQLIGALARVYANLGLLTEHHWSRSSKVFRRGRSSMLSACTSWNPARHPAAGTAPMSRRWRDCKSMPSVISPKPNA